jgi:hypothetical protein
VTETKTDKQQLVGRLRDKMDDNWMDGVPDTRSGFDNASADYARPANGGDVEALEWYLSDLDTFAQDILQRQDLIMEALVVLLGDD